MNDQQGSVLILTLIVMVILSIFAAVVVKTVVTTNKFTTNNSLGLQAFYQAESGLEAVYHQILAGNYQTGETTFPDGSWIANWQFPFGPDGGKYKYKITEQVDKYQVETKGQYKGRVRKIYAEIAKGAAVDQIVDNNNLHLTGNEIVNYPWQNNSSCQTVEMNTGSGPGTSSLLKKKHIFDLFDFERFKEIAKQPDQYGYQTDHQRYFGNQAKQYSNNNNFGGENLFQQIYSSRGAGSPWVGEATADIQDEYFGYGLDETDVFGMTDFPEPPPGCNVPGGVFYLDPDDQGFRLELGSEGLKGPADQETGVTNGSEGPTVIVVEGDMKIAAYANQVDIENVYFIVKGQVEFTGAWGRGELPAIETTNSFLYANKTFKFHYDPETGRREEIPVDDGRENVGAVDDWQAAVSGDIGTNGWQGPIITSERVDVNSDYRSGTPGYDSANGGVDWNAFGTAFGSGRVVEPQIINWYQN